MAIALQGGVSVPASPGKYEVTPPPDLNEAAENELLLLEYNFPFLLVSSVAITPASDQERIEAIGQAVNWRARHPEQPGVFHVNIGYQFNENESGYRCQFVPDMAYVDKRTWTRVSDEEKRNNRYLRCVLEVVIELMKEKDSIEDLQDKVTKFVDAGTREGVIVDTRRDRVWICNRDQLQYFDELSPIEFASWPGFTLDCNMIRDARVSAGLD